MSVPVRIELGEGRSATAIPLTLAAREHTDWFPAFHGEARSEEAGALASRLRLTGDYEVPLGALGLIVKQDVTEPSNWRSMVTLDNWLRAKDVPGIAGLDTRALTLRIRDGGPPHGVLSFPQDTEAITGYMYEPWHYRYVGLDAASALHPQSLLCDAMNGAPLTAGHGGPLRLVIPVKYGVKNIKQVNEIAFTNRRPADFWAERGYDWVAGS